MHLKKSKDAVVEEAYSRAFYKVAEKLGCMNSDYMTPAQFRSELSIAIALAIKEAMNTLLTNLYTEEDFETDLSLKP